MPTHRTTYLAAVAIAAFVCVAPARPSHATIYQFTDEDGVVHFSNVGVSGAKTYRAIDQDSGASRTVAASVEKSAVRPGRRQERSQRAASETKATAYKDIIDTACDRHGVDPALVHAIVKVESDFNPYAISSKGAMGLMQLMPGTAADLNVHNSFSPHENVDGGVKYLKYLLSRYDGNLSLALAAYNSGESNIKKWGAVPPFKETQEYVKKILRLYNGGGGSAAGSAALSSPPVSTIYIGYADDGTILLTDDPSRHPNKTLKRKSGKEL